MTAAAPDLLTVEEAAAILRVGRTKAYAMAREWRDSGGRSGLPVIDLGHVLRVPRRALEAVMGVELSGPAASEEREDTPAPTGRRATARPRSSPARSRTQPRLFPLASPPSS